jgi:twitching motility protein PilT
MALKIKAILQRMIDLEGSDLHVKVGVAPTCRVHGRLQSLDFPAPTHQDMAGTVEHVLTEAQREIFETTREVDFAFGIPGLARFRANFYVQRGSVAMVFRHVPVDIKTIEELRVPAIVSDLALSTRGLILVTGTVGSGKSTTIAAMIDLINCTNASNIITIEDPVEFLHRDKQCIVNQREVGSDTASFIEALRHILRQDPDVILIGEIRDAETMKTALTAADTGHMVFSTLHTIDASQTIQRIISFFPPYQHEEIRYLLSNTLKAIISQRLIPSVGGNSRIPAVEVMINTSTIQEFIRDPKKTHLISDAIAEGFVSYGMQSFDQSLMGLFKKGSISLEEALRASSNPHEFSLRVKGIQGSSDQNWERFEDRGEESKTLPNGFVKI